ncbi:MAG: deaminase [Oscillospiraceae bacterium]|jgi:dCMP deaminase|nr:deaminase [Oscillospiraceae bacterium]MCI1990070.1 deaminase [Oscillospiraceae bacterium]MCI2034732.1 deaminase [Oscillospiraceae bacterium]
MQRTDKINYYLDIAETVLERGTCLRRNFGAIIVNHDEIISSGYTGAPRGRKNCIDAGYCVRETLGVPRGERYELCRSVHAEMNAIISAARNDMIGATLYLAGKEAKTGEYVPNPAPCSMCKRLIINAGIRQVVARRNKTEYTVTDVSEWVENDESLAGKFGY